MARFTLLACLIAAADAFAPLARPALRAATSVAMAPVDVAQSLDVVSQLPTQLVSLEVRLPGPPRVGGFAAPHASPVNPGDVLQDSMKLLG